MLQPVKLLTNPHNTMLCSIMLVLDALFGVYEGYLCVAPDNFAFTGSFCLVKVGWLVYWADLCSPLFHRGARLHLQMLPCSP